MGEEIRQIDLGHALFETIDVHIRRNRRTRHIRLQVDDSAKVWASVPMRYSATRLDEIVRERADWLAEVLTRVQHAVRAVEIDLHRGDPVRLHGTWHPTRVVRCSGRRSCVRMQEGVVEIALADQADAYDVLRDWYRSLARRVLTERTEHWARRFDLQPGRISIRDQRTRWGSCTHRGDLSFNWRLVLAPLWVLDAIVVHELCHIQHLNHSAEFWALVDLRYPRHREASTWLREHGSALRIARADHATWPPGSAHQQRGRQQQPSLF